MTITDRKILYKTIRQPRIVIDELLELLARDNLDLKVIPKK